MPTDEKSNPADQKLNNIDLMIAKRRLMIDAYRAEGYETDAEPEVVYRKFEEPHNVITGLEDIPIGELPAVGDEYDVIRERDLYQGDHPPTASPEVINRRRAALASFDEQLARLSIKADELKSRGDTKAYASASFLFDQLAYQRQRYVYEGKPFKEFKQNCEAIITKAQSSSKLKDFRGFGYIVNAIGNAFKSLFGGAKNETASIKVTRDIKDSLDTIKRSRKAAEAAPEETPDQGSKLGGGRR
jgi:hypothetical protein